MSKILIVTNHSFMLYKFRKELIQELLKKHSVCLSMPKGGFTEEFIEMGCTFIDTVVDRRGINPFTDSKLLCRYFKLIRDQNPDVIITYSIKPNIYAGIVCRILGIKHCANITGLGTAFEKRGLAHFVSWLYRVAFKRTKKIFFENEANRQVFLDRHIAKAKQMCLLHGAGVNLKEYSLMPYPDTEEIHFLFIGRIMKEKGVDELFETAQRMKTQYPTVVFDVVGPFEDDYEQIVMALHEKQIIRYYGFQNDVRPYLAACHCFVLPSYHEGMANTLLEAGAVGRPLITSNIHGCLEAVLDGKSGYLVNKQDVNDLYEKLKQFYFLTPEEKACMGKNSNLHIIGLFDKEEVVKETVKELEL